VPGLTDKRSSESPRGSITRGKHDDPFAGDPDVDRLAGDPDVDRLAGDPDVDRLAGDRTDDADLADARELAAADLEPTDTVGCKSVPEFAGVLGELRRRCESRR
jgi:hypothetical protein